MLDIQPFLTLKAKGNAFYISTTRCYCNIQRNLVFSIILNNFIVGLSCNWNLKSFGLLGYALENFTVYRSIFC